MKIISSLRQWWRGVMNMRGRRVKRRGMRDEGKGGGRGGVSLGSSLDYLLCKAYSYVALLNASDRFPSIKFITHR